MEAIYTSLQVCSIDINHFKTNAELSLTTNSTPAEHVITTVEKPIDQKKQWQYEISKNKSLEAKICHLQVL
jgi:hypothetical protein